MRNEAVYHSRAKHMDVTKLTDNTSVSNSADVCVVVVAVDYSMRPAISSKLTLFICCFAIPFHFILFLSPPSGCRFRTQKCQTRNCTPRQIAVARYKPIRSTCYCYYSAFSSIPLSMCRMSMCTYFSLISIFNRQASTCVCLLQST